MYEGSYYENPELSDEVLALSESFKTYAAGRIPLPFTSELHLNTENATDKLWNAQTTTSITKNVSLVKIKRSGTKVAAIHRRSYDLSGRYYFVLWASTT